jgi:hypothetical protein
MAIFSGELNSGKITACRYNLICAASQLRSAFTKICCFSISPPAQSPTTGHLNFVDVPNQPADHLHIVTVRNQAADHAYFINQPNQDENYASFFNQPSQEADHLAYNDKRSPSTRFTGDNRPSEATRSVIDWVKPPASSFADWGHYEKCTTGLEQARFNATSSMLLCETPWMLLRAAKEHGRGS